MAHETGRNGRVLALATVAAIAAATAPAAAFDGERPVILAQEGGGFLPGIFGGNRDRQQVEADRELRIQQLESQVRTLTGEVERLSFELRELSSRLEALEGGRPAAAGQRGAAPAATPGAPDAPASRQATAPAASERDGPLDLSALNLGGAAGIGGLPAPGGGGDRASESFEEARRLFEAGRFGESERALRAFMTSFPADPRAGEAAFMIGEILLARGENREAANVFLASYTDFPSGRRAPESLLKLGMALGGMGETEAACSSFRELLGAYPDAPADVRARAEAELASARCG